ncbi:MAG: PHB depolymerase family esterase [Bacteroidales bacterium]|nr:PHB depolymerase family esterase [Bacteroidales bacterium]
MRTLIFSLSFLFLANLVSAQQVNKTFPFGGLTRQYIEYVPSIYDGSEAVPLVICLHGLGDNMTNFSGIGMNHVADTANFIVLTPQAVGSLMGNAWNSGASSGGSQINPNVNDVGFIAALIDSTMAHYNIDQRRIYVTGFSLGAFMTNRLACQLGNRIAAIASVAGTIGSSLNCTPNRAVPVCHFHGTADGTISYTNNSYGLNVDAFIDFWVSNNICDTTPIVTNLPNTAPDSMTVEHYVYGNGENNTVVELFKVNNAGHTWLFTPNNDISYTKEIWNFLSRFSSTDWVSIEKKTTDFELKVFPNPFNSHIQFESISQDLIYIELFDNIGRQIFNGFHNTNDIFSMEHLHSGLYIMKIYSKDKTPLSIQKLIKQ